MKKYLKTQLKKSLSLMMAVLMVLSCWVWVAPESLEAEAANTAEEGYYYVYVRGKLDDWDNDSDVKTNIWKITTANGTYTLTSSSVHNGGSTSDDYIHAQGWVYGFPTGISHQFANKDNGKSGSDLKYNGDGWGVREAAIWVGDGAGKSVQISSTSKGYKTVPAGDTYTNEEITTFWNDITPKATTVEGSGSDITIEIPADGAQQTASPSWTPKKYYDQYGVRLLSGGSMTGFKAGTAYIAKTATGDDIKSDDIYYDTTSGKVVVNSTLQVNSTNPTNGTYEAYLVQPYSTGSAETGNEVISKFAAKITVKYPHHTVTVDGAGSISGHKYKTDLTGGTTTSSAWTASGYYSAAFAGAYPTGTASAKDENGNDTHTFYGFWTNKQPSAANGSYDASYNATTTAFASPISSEKFNEYKDAGGTVSGNYITYNGATYYNAGKQWDPKDAKVTSSDTYYGWWLSKDITVKFYDIDGAYLGSESVKYGQNQSDIVWPTPKESWVAGPYKYSNFDGTWSDLNGDVVKQNGHTFTKDLILTPNYKVTVDNMYSIKFVNEANGNGLTGSGDYIYRTNLSTAGVIPTDRGIPSAIRNDLQYSYSFVGWSAQAPESGYYHILQESGNINAEGKEVHINTDWIVRSDATYYPVYRRAVRTYAVNFWYNDSSGTKVSRRVTVKYGDTLKAPVDYVPFTWAAEGYGYEFISWGYKDGKNQDAALGYNNSITFTKENIYFGLGAVAGTADEVPVAITAKYTEGIPTPYTVTFKYKNDNGEDLTYYAEVNHGEEITADVLANIVTAGKYDNGEALVHFTNTWTVVDGTAEYEVYETNDLASFSPTSHITFEAVYGNPQYFYTVKYIDGAKDYSERILAGLNVPGWVVDGEEYVPAKEKNDKGTFEFAGWYDEPQKDSEYKVTNGTKYTQTDTVTGDLILYPQFKFSAFKFDIIFWNHDKTVQLGGGQYEYGQKFDDAFYWAQRGAQTREPDETYEYEFIGWDQPYNEENLMCEGKNVEFVALYKAKYIYYDAQWYSGKKDNAGNWLVDENKLLATTKHTYNSKLYAPSADFGFLPDGYVFDGWYYKDANGTEQPYVRGMLITGDMTFYAKYRQAAITHTVTAVVGGKPTNYTVADGQTAKQIADPVAGYGDEKWHSAFVGWYTDSSYQTAFDIANTPITEDIEIFARVVSAPHTLSEKELVSAPTYYAAGSEKAWCSCSREKTEVTREIPMLTDTVAPTGTIYLGTLGSWSSTDEVGAAATDGDKVELYVNDKTDIVLTINDTGDVNTAYNPAGFGKGIALIQGIISTGVFGADTTEIAGIQTIFSDASQDSNNTANYVISLGEYEGLEDGKTYIAYYYVKDKAGNVLNKNVRTAKFIYDTTAPEFIIEGASNASKVGESVATYCGKAVIKGIENDATVTVNGEAVTLTTAGISGTTAYTINEAGNYTITVTDKAGNSASKKIVVADGHNEYVSKKAAACGVAGFEKVVCLVCDKVISETTIPALQHEWEEVTKAATCTAPGEKYNECKLCGETTEPEAIPQLAHTYATDGEGNIIYTVEKEANCSVKGKETAACTLCGTKLERAIATNDVHVYGPLKTIKATCTGDGMKYKTCKLCNETYTVETIEATGHVDTQWVVTKDATCGTAGTETLKCKACGVGVDSADEDDVVDTREIPATNRHILAVSTDPAKTFDATADSEGQITHYCTQCGKEWSKPIDKIVKYTVSFVGENGTTKLVEDMVVLTGTTITAEMAPVATKDSDDQYDYTFAGWVDNATGKTVKLPYDVTADITLKATFAESTRVYVHIFKVPTTWAATTEAEESTVVFANIMGAYDDTNKKPAAVPVFTHEDPQEDARLKKLYTFEFDYWKDIYGNKVDDFTMKGDATFTAQFKTTPVTYKVIYYNGTELVWNTTVNGGANVTFGGTLPTKDSDAENHYAFNKWYTDATLKTAYNGEAITALTRLYAGFTATAHSYDKSEGKGEVTQEANCVLPELTTYTCECGHKLTEQTKDALGHALGEYEYDEETGMNVAECSRCDYKKSVPVSVTIKFVNENEVALAIYTKIKIDSTVTYDFEKYGTPEKTATESETYEFAGWKDADGKEYAKDFAFVAGEVDAVYTAYYTATPRTFRVTYVDVNNKTLQTQDGIAYGAAVPGFEGTNPTKAKDDTNHYTFATWSVAADATVTTDLVIKPVFTAEKHTYNAGEETGGSCTEASGMKYTCTVCGHSYTDGGAPATGHDYVVTNRTEPNYETGTDGAEIYTCTKCGDSYSKEISGDMIEILVNVKDANGNPVKDARVDLYYKSNNAPTGHFDYSDADGIVRFYVVPGEYKVLITADGMKDSSYDVTVNENGETQSGTAVMQPEEVDTSCKCSCHRDNFWGVIFRFFQKIIKLFTGKAACCSDPDSRI